MDISVAAAALLALSPLMLAIALFIKMVSPGSVFFRQERVGFLGRRFACLNRRRCWSNPWQRTRSSG